MQLTAVSVMRNEEDICAQVVAHWWRQGADRVLVGDHLSTDRTRDCLIGAGAEVVRIDEPGWWQSRYVTNLVEQAGRDGADWVVPFDADEFWFDPGGLTVRHALNMSPNRVELAVTWERYGLWRAPTPKRWGKVAFRYTPGVVVADGNHDVAGVDGPVGKGRLAIAEYQYRTFDQLRRKVRDGKAALELTDLPDFQGAHWRELGALDDQELRVWWEDHRDSLNVWDPVEWDPVEWDRR